MAVTMVHDRDNPNRTLAINSDGSINTTPQGGGTQDVNVTKLAGTAVDTNSGNKSAGTIRVVMATDQPALTNAQPSQITDTTIDDYETVAASQTDQSLGATGATGDILMGVLIVPATTSPDAVSIKDGSGSAITIFTGGASSVSNLAPIMVPLGIKSTGGAWKVTTGASVSAIGVGKFT